MDIESSNTNDFFPFVEDASNLELKENIVCDIIIGHEGSGKRTFLNYMLGGDMTFEQKEESYDIRNSSEKGTFPS